MWAYTAWHSAKEIGEDAMADTPQEPHTSSSRVVGLGHTLPAFATYLEHYIYRLECLFPLISASNFSCRLIEANVQHFFDAAMVHEVSIINDGNVVEAASPIQQKLSNGTHGTKRTKSAVLHRSLHHDPFRVVSGRGNYLYLTNGEKIFDATGGAAVACLGHGNERISNAVADQMSKVSYCHSLLYATEATEDLANLLIESTCKEMARAFIISSGSEAIEAALKMTRQYHLEKSPPEPSRTHVIARQQSYHGTTLGALAVGGHVARRALYEPILSQNSSHVSPCYAYRGMRSILDSKTAYLKRLEDELDAEFQRLGPQNIAAFIAEPVVGAALGCVPPVEGYFAAVRRICDRYGALLIMDEIMSGCGRVGPEPSPRYKRPLHAWQDPLIGVVPDIMCMGKGLGGGYQPVAAMLANHKVIDVLDAGTGAFSHGQTYQGHPVACRAAAEVQRIIREEDLVGNVREKGKLLGELLTAKVGAHWAVGDVRGKGLFWGIEFVSNKATKEPYEPGEGIAMGLHELALQPPFNISLYPGTGTADGQRGDHVLLAPAYNVTDADIRQIVDTTAAAITRFFKLYADRGIAREEEARSGEGVDEAA